MTGFYWDGVVTTTSSPATIHVAELESDVALCGAGTDFPASADSVLAHPSRICEPCRELAAKHRDRRVQR